MYVLCSYTYFYEFGRPNEAYRCFLERRSYTQSKIRRVYILYISTHEFKLRQLCKDAPAVSQTAAGLLKGLLLIQLLFISEFCGTQK